MNVQQALWHIIEKTHFIDYDFTDEFLEMIKTNPEYDGLYDILNLRICRRFGIRKNLRTEIKTSHPYLLVQQIINLYNTSYTIFQIEEYNDFAKKTLDMMYEEIDKIFKEDKDNIDPHTNILILLSCTLETTLFYPHKYPEHPIIQKCIAFSNMNKVVPTYNIVLIKKQIDIFEEKYNGVAQLWIKHVTTMIQCINEKQDIKQIAECSSILFPNKQMKMYIDIAYFLNLCGELQKKRLAKKYEYADYVIDIPPYADFTDMFNHYIQTVRLTFELEIKKDNSGYVSYLKHLFENNKRFFSQNMFLDYISMLNNNKDYAEVYDISKKYKKNIMHTLQSQYNMLAKLTLIFVIVNSGYNTNKNVSKKEINEIMENIKPGDYVDTGSIKTRYAQVISIIDMIKERDRGITNLGFDIVDRSKVDETCLVCLENIDDTNIETVKCICCKKELGHINCICEWIKNKQTCPNCRSNVEQRMVMKE